MGRVREEKKKSETPEKRIEKNEDAGARKGRKVSIHAVFPMTCGSGVEK